MYLVHQDGYTAENGNGNGKHRGKRSWPASQMSLAHMEKLVTKVTSPMKYGQKCNLSPECLASAPILPFPCPQSCGETLAPGLVGGEEMKPKPLYFSRATMPGQSKGGTQTRPALFGVAGSDSRMRTCWKAALQRRARESWWKMGWLWTSSVPLWSWRPMVSWGVLGRVWPAGHLCPGEVASAVLGPVLGSPV